MRRREFITLLGSEAMAWPLTARAQQPAGVRHIGVLMGYAESDQEGQTFVAAFREELQKLGWIEDRTIKIDTRWASPRDPELRQRAAKELVALRPDLILSHGTPVTATLLQQTRTIPIIFVNVADSVGSGFVASFNRPGGNVTGLTNIEPTMAGKYQRDRAGRHAGGILVQSVGGAICRILPGPIQIRCGVTWPARDRRTSSQHVRARICHCRTRRRSEWRPCRDARYLHEFKSRETITSLAARYRLPTVYPFRFFTEAGGLLSYGSDTADNFRRAATYADFPSSFQ